MGITGEFTTYDAVGIKEDISDIITNISPTKTPFQSQIGNEKITQPLFQWQEDKLASAGVNAQAEGADATFASLVPTVMRNNRTQILTKTVMVSGTMDVTSTYGRARESAYQMAKKSAEIKRDFEVALVGVGYQPAVVGNNSGPTARQLASFQAQLGDQGTAGDTKFGTAGSYYGHIKFTGATTTPLAESISGTGLTGGLLESLQECYNNGAEPNTISVVPARAVTVAGFALSGGSSNPASPTTAASRVRSSDGTTLVNSVTLYRSPYGDVKVVINRFQTGSPLAAATTNHVHTLVYEPNMWVKATLRSWFREVLSKTGDSTKQMIVGEFSLKHKNYRASSIIVENVAPTSGTTDMAVATNY